MTHSNSFKSFAPRMRSWFTPRKQRTIRRVPTAQLLLEHLEDWTCPSLPPSLNTNFSFADQLGDTTMTLAFDGTHYWSSSGGSSGGIRYAEYTSSGSPVATFAPGLDFRSVFTDAAGNVYARQYADPTIYKQTSPGVFASSGIVLSGGFLDAQSSVVFNGAGTEFIAMEGGHGLSMEHERHFPGLGDALRLWFGCR